MNNFKFLNFKFFPYHLVPKEKSKIWQVGGLHSTEEAFLLPTQQPQDRIPAQPRFFFLRIFLFSSWTVLITNPSGAMP